MVVDVRFLLERYHGSEWPPSPRRLFLAMVSALYQSRGRFDTGDGDKALQYLEQQGPPRIEADGKAGTPYTLFVPNNDLDIIAKDYAKYDRSDKDPKTYTTGKQMRPYITRSVRYVWTLPPNMTDEQKASVALLCGLACEVPVLGLGIDPVTVGCRLLDTVTPLAGAQAYVPDDSDSNLVIDVPIKGMLDDAKRRHAEFLNQVTRTGFVKPRPITRKEGQGYRKEGPPTHKLVTYRLEATESKRVVPRGAVSDLAAKLHDMCGTQLDGARILILPSIGHRHADSAVRRVGLLIPESMHGTAVDRLRARLDSKIVSVKDIRFQLVSIKSSEDGVSRMYARKSRVWRSVAPFDPGDLTGVAGKQGATDMLAGELAEMGLKDSVVAIRLDKIPDWNGLEGLARDTNLWYAEIEFRSPVSGPLILGKGAERGLGLLAPAVLPDVAYYAVVGKRPPIMKTVGIADAVRTAVMSQVGRLRRDRYVPRSLSGHDEHGKPLRDNHTHAFWLPIDNDGDGLIDHVAVYAKNGFEPSTQRAFAAVTDVHAERSILVRLRFVGLHKRGDLEKQCRAFGKGKVWMSSTPYYTPWHSKAKFGVVEQVKKELRNHRRSSAKIIPDKGGATIQTDAGTVPARLFDATRTGRTPPHGYGHRVTICFDSDENGPLLLGNNSHFGLGTFVPDPNARDVLPAAVRNRRLSNLR